MAKHVVDFFLAIQKLRMSDRSFVDQIVSQDVDFELVGELAPASGKVGGLWSGGSVLFIFCALISELVCDMSMLIGRFKWVLLWSRCEAGPSGVQ